MRFVEESEGSFSTAQLAAAERELEEQKKEWELDRLRALREEEERRMRLADDDEEKPLTFGREDAQNQVNNAAVSRGGSKRLVTKRISIPSRRSSRKRGYGGSSRGGTRESSRSESETTTSTDSESESESQEDVVEDSLDEESSHTESQSQGDEGEGEEEGEKGEDEREEEASEENEDERTNNANDTERGGGFSRRKSRLMGGSCSRNHFDLNSPRTRSRGNVQINLWTLDVSPILPGVKPNCRRQQRGKKFHRAKSEETLSLPLSPSSSVVTSPKRNSRINANVKASTDSDQNMKTELTKVVEEDQTSSKDDRSPLKNCRASSKDDRVSSNDRGSTTSSIDSNGMEWRIVDSNTQRSRDDKADPTLIAKTQAKMLESVSDNVEGGVKEEKKGNDKVPKGINLVTAVCSVQVTRCTQKPSSVTYKKFGSEVNRNEDAENLDVNVSARNSRSSPSTTQSDASLKRAKEMTVKSVTELVASANSFVCNTRMKLNVTTSKEPEQNIESLSSRSIPHLRSKTLQSPDISSDKIPKATVAISRISVAQRNPKSNVNINDTSRANEEDDACNEDNNDNTEPIIVSSTRKYASQKYNSKNDMCEKSDLLKKRTNDSIYNSLSEPTTALKNETNSNESKCKIRRLVVDTTVISRGVTTRSSKVPPLTVDNCSEESNAQLPDDKIDTALEISKSNSQQTKIGQNARKSDMYAQQLVTEQSRITRSTATTARSFTPPPIGDARNSPSRLTRRRPGTPLPRPVTRSALTVMNSTVTSVDSTTTAATMCRSEKHVTRNSKICQDNGFMNSVPFEHSNSIPLMKMESNKEASVVIERTNIHAKHRPDTPRPGSIPPNSEQVSRVTRSALTLNTAAAKSSPSPFSPSNATSILKINSKQQSRNSPTSESNSNENTERGATSIPFYACEKPQRTAKVVAILTLDTRSNHHHHHNSKTLSSIQTKSTSATSGGSLEAKVQDKELLVARLSDSLKDQETDNEDDEPSPDSKSKRLRKETKRGRIVPYEENDELDSNDEPQPRRTAVRHSPPSSVSTTSPTQTITRSEKLKSATIS